MSEIFFTSDQHYDHKNIIEYENRPFKSMQEMNEALIDNHNKVVKPSDRIYILGDLSFGNPSNILDRLNGEKILILGNHDRSWIKRYPHLKTKFYSIHDYLLIKNGKRKIVLFHYPIMKWDMQHYHSYHLFGHIHSRDPYPLGEDRNILRYSYNVGVDVNNYTPISFEEIRSKLKEAYGDVD